MTSQNLGIGASVALDIVNRNTQAYIGDASNDLLATEAGPLRCNSADHSLHVVEA